MIRTLLFCGSLLYAQAAIADGACLNQYVAKNIAVTDVRMLDAKIGVDLQNDTPFLVAGYALFYVFQTDSGQFSEELPMYMLKAPIEPDAVRAHRMQISEFELLPDEINNVVVHVVSVEALRPLGVEMPMPSC